MNVIRCLNSSVSDSCWVGWYGSCLLEPNDVYFIQEHFCARMTLNLSPMTDGSGFPALSGCASEAALVRREKGVVFCFLC